MTPSEELTEWQDRHRSDG